MRQGGVAGPFRLTVGGDAANEEQTQFVSKRSLLPVFEWQRLAEHTPDYPTVDGVGACFINRSSQR